MSRDNNMKLIGIKYIERKAHIFFNVKAEIPDQKILQSDCSDSRKGKL